MNTATPFRLRSAEPADVPAIVGLIRELAAYENLTHLVQVTADRLAPHLFGPRPVVEAVVAEHRAAGLETDDAGGNWVPPIVGFALFFTNFSTFLGKPGLYMEDLYVQPAHRGTGLGRALLQHLGALAVERDCSRFEWSVLDWNEGAIGFYQSMGAQVLPNWRICRVAGPALAAFGRKAEPADPARG